MLGTLVISLLLTQISSTVHVFPIFPDGIAADGTAHTSALYLQNPSFTFTASCTITFYGALPEVRGLDGRTIRSFSISQILPPGGFNVLNSTSFGPLTNSYVKILCTVPVGAQTIYSVYSRDDLLSETSQDSSLEATGFQYINDSRQGGRLALAFTNDNLFNTVVQVTVGDLFGRTLSVTNIVVPAYSTVARFLDEIAPTTPRQMVGAVVIRSSQRIYTSGLRFTGNRVTTVSPTAQFQ